jgi:hypothetical protein
MEIRNSSVLSFYTKILQRLYGSNNKFETNLTAEYLVSLIFTMEANLVVRETR